MSDTTSIKVEGIQFRTVMPDQTILAPLRQNGAVSKVSFGLQITRLSGLVDLFLMFYLCPEILDMNHQAVQRIGPSQNGRLPNWYNFMLVLPGESITFTRQADLYWQQNSLTLTFRERSGKWWTFPNLTPGQYFARMDYRNPYDIWNQQNAMGMELEEICDVWSHPVKSPPIAFELLLPEE